MLPEKAWLLEWFKSRGTLVQEAALDGTDHNYFEAGLIDSLGVIELISDIESSFGITFTEQHFQDRRFSTVDGLAEMMCSIRVKG